MTLANRSEMSLAEIFQEDTTRIAPGVLGVLYEEPGALIVNYVRAEQEGSGAVGRWLDAIPKALTVRVIAVTSERLVGMLERRGFKYCHVLMPAADDWCPAYVRRGER